MWKVEVIKILQDKGRFRVNGKQASERTQALTRQIVFACFSRLNELGFRIQEPKNLSSKHIQALVTDAWHVKKKKIKTIKNELSRLNIFCGMMGKPGLVGSIEKYLPDIDPKLLKVQVVAKASKSWSAHGIDIVAKFKEVDERDWRLGLMLRLELAFGLRRAEVIKCDPHAQDYGHYLQVFPGQGKGGRWRNIPSISAAQRATLDYVKSQVPKNQPLGWTDTVFGKTASLKQNIKRYENLMASLGFTKEELGVTGHGLRAQFAENHSLLLGVLPPTLGGLPGQMAADDLRLKRTRLSQALGHNRPSITNAYIGSFRHVKTNGEADRGIETIKYALTLMGTAGLNPVPIERMRDCFLIQDIFSAVDVCMSHDQAHELWGAHARRHGVEWMKPEMEIGLAVEVEALAFINVFLTKKEGK